MSLVIISGIFAGVSATITAIATAYSQHVVAKLRAETEERDLEIQTLEKVLRTEKEYSDRLLMRVKELEKIVDNLNTKT